MPSGAPQRQQTPSEPLSPSSSASRATHIRNKDGTKLITVPPRKVPHSEPAVAPAPAPLPQPPSPMAYSVAKKNRKKKRTGKSHIMWEGTDDGHYAHAANGPASPPPPPPPPPHDAHPYQQDIRQGLDRIVHDVDDDDDELPLDEADEDDDEYYSEEDVGDEEYEHLAAAHAPAPPTGKKKNKKKKKKAANGQDHPGAVAPPGRGKGKDRIWNTSTAEERERIKDFWLSLGETERRSLVKVEKEAVLKKMKEQQRHSCSCSVCGRKRTAIEEELEVLYDAYYEELEQYANQQQGTKPNYGGAATFLPRPPPRSPSPGEAPHPDDVSEEYEEEYDDDVLDEEDEDDVDHHRLPPNDPRPDFFNFGNSLTVQGGILTVADDLLKNDGKKFIEMMEQLAERRMQREEEASQAANGHIPTPLHQHQIHAAHNHPQEQYDEEEYDEDEEEEEYDDDEEEEEDEPDTMTEEQRMEEGRRMFQIFAARMFEQRVLTAYREKVAKERQMKLLEELEEDKRREEERELRKAREKDKKKERKRLQKQAKEEERMRKEAERANEEARLKEAEQKKVDEQRKRKEEQRLKREAERKALEEERLRKEEEKRKRLQEEREREAERERKKKEHQERERKKKEEEKKKRQEEKEAREKEARERKEKEEQARKEREAKAKEAALEKEQKRREEEAKAKADALATRKSAPSAPSSMQPPTAPAGFSSPHLSVVAPAMPKQAVGSSPGRTRNASQQGSLTGSVGSSPKTPQVAPPAAAPSTPILQQNTPGPMLNQNKAFQFPAGTMPPSSPMTHNIAPPPGVVPPEHFGSLSPMNMNGMMQQPFLGGMPPQRQSMGGNGMPLFPPMPPPQLQHPQYRGFAAPNGMPMQVPAAPGMRAIPQQGRGFFNEGPTHQFPPGVPLPPPGSPFMGRPEHVPNSHSRSPSGSFEYVPRPTPIQRPASVVPPRPVEEQQDNVDELAEVMGSRALLDDEPLDENMSPSRRASGPTFAPRPMRHIPMSSPVYGDPIAGGDVLGHHSWANPAPLGGLGLSSSLPGSSPWGNGAGATGFPEAIKPVGNGYTASRTPLWSDGDGATRSNHNRRRVSRLDHVRTLVCQQFGELAGPGPGRQQVELTTLQRRVERAAPADLAPIAQKEINEALEVEGDPQNGGGNFRTESDKNGRRLVEYEPGPPDAAEHPLHHHGPSSLGEIGSPSLGSASLFRPTAFAPPPGMASPAGF